MSAGVTPQVRRDDGRRPFTSTQPAARQPRAPARRRSAGRPVAEAARGTCALCTHGRGQGDDTEPREVGADLRGRRVAVLGVLGHSRWSTVPHRRRNVLAEVGRLAKHAGEGSSATDALRNGCVRRSSRRESRRTRTGSDRGRAETLHLLRRHVVGRADDARRATVNSSRPNSIAWPSSGCADLEALGEAEVHDLHVPMRGHHDVGGLQSRGGEMAGACASSSASAISPARRRASRQRQPAGAQPASSVSPETYSITRNSALACSPSLEDLADVRVIDLRPRPSPRGGGAAASWDRQPCRAAAV